MERVGTLGHYNVRRLITSCVRYQSGVDRTMMGIVKTYASLPISTTGSLLSSMQLSATRRSAPLSRRRGGRSGTGGVPLVSQLHPPSIRAQSMFAHRNSLSLWYPRHMLHTRFALFWGGATLAGAFSGLFAFVISFMSGTAGLLGWSWIFVSCV